MGNVTIAERRQFGRRLTWKPAHIVVGGAVVASCVVIDISIGGAALQMRGDIELPSEFDLVIIPDDMIVLCRMMHRTGDRIGLQFLRSPRIASRAYKTGSNTAKKVRHEMGQAEGK